MTNPPYASSTASNVAARLATHSRNQGWRDNPAVHDDSKCSTWTHGELHERAARTAGLLRRYGVAAGERVVVCLEDGPEWFVCFLALARLGASAVLVNPELPAETKRRLWRQVGARRGIVSATVGHAPEREPTSWTGSTLVMEALAAEPVEPAPVTAASELYIQFSSGTTGHPKAVAHTHGDLDVFFDVVGRHALELTTGDVAVSVSKLYFAYGFNNSFVYTLYSGASTVLHPRRRGPEEVHKTIHRYGATVLYSVPSALAGLAAYLEEHTEANLPTLRAVVSAGESLRSSVRDRLTARVAAPILEQIGCTEVGNAFCAATIHHHPQGSVGRATPGYEVELRNHDPLIDEQHDWPTGAGEVWVKGPTIPSHAIESNGEAAALLRDEWLSTGDIAYWNEDDSLTWLGRSDDMEVVGGITVAPAEIEAILDQHPAVGEAVVVAVTDHVGATKLRAFIEATDDKSDALAEELLGMARARLAAYKVPRSIEFVSALPRTASGKVQRRRLKNSSPVSAESDSRGK